MVSVAEEEQFSKECRLGRLCGGLLSKSSGIVSLTEHWLMHSASDVVGTEKMFALSSAVPLHLIFKVLPLSPL